MEAMTRIFDRYILREFIPPFFGGLLVFCFILMMDKVLRLTDLIVMKGMSLRAVGILLMYLIPPLIAFTLPIAILFASLMSFGRMASDNEITALRSCGKHPVRIIIPAIVFGVLAAGLCLWLEIAVIPFVNRSVKDTMTGLQEQKAFLSITERSFQNIGKDMVMYVHKGKGRDGQVYQGILITDHSMHGHSRVIAAREGDIVMDESAGTAVFSLSDGSIHRLEREGEGGYQVLRFGTYENVLSLEGPSVLRRGKKKSKELSLREIGEMLGSDSLDFKEEIGLMLEWHRRFAFPLACIIFAFIGSLIGMESRWSGRSSSFAVSIVVIIAYYLLLTAGSRLSTAGYLPPWIAAWLPNITFAATGVGLFRGVF